MDWGKVSQEYVHVLCSHFVDLRREEAYARVTCSPEGQAEESRRYSDTTINITPLLSNEC